MGKKVFKLMELGELVPTVSQDMISPCLQVSASCFQTVVLDLLAEAMIKAIDEGAKGFLLDAFPMNIEQAEAFESFIGIPAKIVYLSLAQVKVYM